MSRTDFRAAAARRLSEERDLSPAIVSLLSPEHTHRNKGVRIVPLDKIEPNPQNPRLAINQEALEELAASIREHGILQPVLVRPLEDGRFELIAGERRWRASKLAEQAAIPAIVEDIDDDTALEIAIIENLQREDISPLDEAVMYDRMVREHGYSIRKLAEKLGKDKGYLENRLRLADAPPEIRELVSLRKDTLSHAYELMKVEDPKKRRRLAEQVGRNELSLVKLRERIEGRRPRVAADAEALDAGSPDAAAATTDEDGWSTPAHEAEPIRDDSLVNAKAQLNDAVEELLDVIRNPEVLAAIGSVDRSNLAKYLTIAKLRLENAIAVVRSGDGDR
ncbi:MAG TPA: ParB/RepB/Spo0J family partition protein [Candidatus Limnocylindrales bacterium]|nr:ParB/RepB/Spo0J family partition protein [Candidatus Limnocylindrales bacterium]